MSAVAAVHDGFVLQKATTRAPLGGALLTQATLRAAEAKAPVLPRCAVRRVEKTPGTWEVRTTICKIDVLQVQDRPNSTPGEAARSMRCYSCKCADWTRAQHRECCGRRVGLCV